MLNSISSPSNLGALLAWVSIYLSRFAPQHAHLHSPMRLTHFQADSMLVLAPRDSGLRVKKAEALYDGATFSLLLEILDDEYNPLRVQQALAANSANTDEHRSRNLHIIHMALNDFARRKSPKIEPLIRNIDFQALARQPTKHGMAEILRVFLGASVWNMDDSKREECINLIMQLDGNQQRAISDIIKDADSKLKQEAELLDTDTEASGVSADVDADLAREAEIVGLERDVDEARRQAANLKMRLDRIQDNYDELVRKHEDLQYENEELQKQVESEAGNFDKHRLQRQLRENETLIANLENQRNDLIDQKERLEREKARLEVQVQKSEHLVDENHELRSRNEELSKKANMADNLRKKVEAYRPMETELKALQNDKVDVMKAYADLEKANTRIAAMRLEQEQYAKKMQGYEIDIAGFQDQKTMWKTENHELRVRIQYLEQQALSDESTVKDLQDKIQMLDPSARPDTPSASSHPIQSLEDELRDSNTVSTNISMRDIEVQRLQAENALLRNSIGTETEKGLLLQELEDVRVSRQQLQERYNEILEKYTIGQAQIDSLITNMGSAGLVATIDACYKLDPNMKWLMSDYFRDEAYSNLRTQVLAEQNIAKDLRRQLEALQQRLADKERELLQARGDSKIILLEYLLDGCSSDSGFDADDELKVNAVEKSSFDALEELKKTDGMIGVSLRAELDAERKKSKALRDEGDSLQKQLLTAFIEKDQLRRETENANRKLQEAIDGQNPTTDFIRQGEKFEKLRAKAKELKEVSLYHNNGVSSPSVVVFSPAATVVEYPDSPVSDWSEDDEGDDEGDKDVEKDDIDGEEKEEDEEDFVERGDGIEGKQVEVRRQSMWAALTPRSPWGNGVQHQRNNPHQTSSQLSPPQSSGFYPYQTDVNGSFGFPQRPISMGGAALPSGNGGSGFNSTTRKRPVSQAISVPETKSSGNRLSQWLGIGGGN